jgi:hypothetical protein
VTDLLQVLQSVSQSDAPSLVLLAFVLFELRRMRRELGALPCKAQQQPPAGPPPQGGSCPEVIR